MRVQIWNTGYFLEPGPFHQFKIFRECTEIFVNFDNLQSECFDRRRSMWRSSQRFPNRKGKSGNTRGRPRSRKIRYQWWINVLNLGTPARLGSYTIPYPDLYVYRSVTKSFPTPAGLRARYRAHFDMHLVKNCPIYLNWIKLTRNFVYCRPSMKLVPVRYLTLRTVEPNLIKRSGVPAWVDSVPVPVQKSASKSIIW